jgi:hypothetical protein
MATLQGKHLDEGPGAAAMPRSISHRLPAECGLEPAEQHDAKIAGHGPWIVTRAEGNSRESERTSGGNPAA